MCFINVYSDNDMLFIFSRKSVLPSFFTEYPLLLLFFVVVVVTHLIVLQLYVIAFSPKPVFISMCFQISKCSLSHGSLNCC